MHARGIFEQREARSMTYQARLRTKSKQLAEPMIKFCHPAYSSSRHERTSSASEKDSESIGLLDFPAIEWVDDSCSDLGMYEVVSNQVRHSASPRKVGKATTRKTHHQMLRSLAVRQKLASLYDDDNCEGALQHSFKT